MNMGRRLGHFAVATLIESRVTSTKRVLCHSVLNTSKYHVVPSIGANQVCTLIRVVPVHSGVAAASNATRLDFLLVVMKVVLIYGCGLAGSHSVTAAV